MKFESEFEIGQKVKFDDVHGVIIVINLRKNTILASSLYAQYQVAYWCNGIRYEAWFDSWQLEPL